ncbi:MAG: hypothetical protein FWD24_02110 [Treponema sp.]|nr:hypothetical protein [Treponema sp.]
MKNTIKLLGIIAFITIIGLVFLTCDDSGGDSNNTKVPSELRGTWKWTSGNITWTTVLKSTTMTVTHAGYPNAKDNGTIKSTIIELEPFAVPAPYNATFPNGYTMTFKVTSSNCSCASKDDEGVFIFAVNAARTQAIDVDLDIWIKQ